MKSVPSPRKVTHLTSVHSATDPRIVLKECTTLAEEGYEVVVIAPGPQLTLPANMRHHAIPTPRNRSERFTRTIWYVFRAACAERADVYHFHDPELLGVGLVLRLRGASVIFDVHEDIPQDIKTKPWIPQALRPAISAAASLILRCVQGCFTAIVPATPSIARSFTHRRTVVVCNYPRCGDLALASEAIPFAKRPPAAIYMGSITVLRGIDQMVLAMAQPAMPSDARLLLAGEFEDDPLRARVATLPGWSRVDALGQLPRPALAAALARARIGLLLLLPAPNHDYAMPTKLFEYMGVSLPVIVSKFLLAYRGIIEEYQCGILVDPRDPEEIAEAMRFLFDRPDLAREMGERGRSALSGRYEWNNEARSLLTLYREIAS